MLVIRLQRTGRSGHAQYRVVLQDSRTSPKSGKVIAQLGHFDPHSKKFSFDKEKIEHFIKNGAQPSERVAKLLKDEKIKLPVWVKASKKKETEIKNPEKLRKNRPVDSSAHQDPAAADKAEEPVLDEPENVSSAPESESEQEDAGTSEPKDAVEAEETKE
jgi:small subunit ribosomal protein S16